MPASGALVGSGSGSWIVPSNVYSIKIDAWGGGGAGAGQSTTGTGGLAGGAGGAHSISTISVTPGQIIYWVVGASRTGTSGNAANGNDTWVNELTNSSPTSSNDGVLAKGGQSAVGITSGVGTTTGSVGQTIYRGGSGRVGGATAGGGGSGAGTSLNGVDATGTAGATAPAGGGNGGSGHASGGNGTAGSTPGGGGGGAYKNNTTSRNGGAGAAGRVILTYTAIPVCATLTSPTNNSTDILLTQTLNWGTVSGATSYDVYFGTNSSPPFVTNQVGTSYTPTLSNSTTYYWKIIPKNSAGTALSCSTWSFTTTTPGCTNGSLYPSTTYSPSCSGSFENITTLGYAGEYSNVSLISNVQYTFNSSVSTDFITITNSGGTTKYIYGTTPITYTPTSDEVVRVYVHTNSSCGTQATSRTKQVKCSIPPPSNDLCSGAISTTCDVTWNGSTNYATQTGDAPVCYTAAFETWTAPGVWYKVVGNGQNITLSLCTGTSFDTKLFVYTGVCGSLTCLTYNDDFCSSQSQVTISSTNNTDYYVLVTGYGSAKGNFQLGVTYTSSPPTITTQPINLQTCTTPQTFSVVASGVRTPFTYQWYRNGVSISGANSDTYSTSTLGNYYVQVTNSCNQSTNSNTVTLSLATSPIVTIPSTSQICAGGSGTNNITSSVTLGIPTYTYQWQFNSGSWSNTVITSTINATPTVTRDYRVIVTDGNGCKDTSNIHTVTVIPDPINPTLNTKTPNTNNVCVGTDLSATFNSGSSGVGCSDIFQYTINGTSWSNYIPGTTISTSSLNDGVTVQIRGRRGNCTTGIGCSNNSYDILSTWVVVYPPTSTLTSINVSCNGGSDGSIDLTPTGNSPFTFSWSNGGTTEDISNLTSGNYSVTITDNNLCSSTNSVTITQPTLLTSSLTSVNVSCFNGVNGSINLTPSGGTSPYSYSWSNGSTNQDLNFLPANTYSVTITDSKGCTTTNSVTITQPSTITLTTSVTNVNCFGENNGSLSVTNISGGTSPYIILWGNGSNQNTISNLTAGNYNLTITDSKGCNKMSTYNVSEPSLLSISTTISVTPTCGSSNGVINSSVVGGTPPYFYSWSNGSTSQNLTNVSSGNYTLTVTDSKNCTTQTTINLGCNVPTIVVGNISGDVVVCPSTQTSNPINYTINYSGDNPDSITWVLPNNAHSTNLHSNPVSVIFDDGFYEDSIKVNVYSGAMVYTRSYYVRSRPLDPIVSGNVCSPTSGTINQYVVTNSTPGVTYTWTQPYGVNIFSGQGNDTVKLKFANSYFTNGSIVSVLASNECGQSESEFKVYKLVNRPTAIIGNSSICADNFTIYTYRVDSVPTAFSYIWGLPNGCSLVSGQGNDTIRVKFSTTFIGGNFSVMSVNPCGSSPMTYYSVSNNNLYSNIGTITGPGDLCPYLGQSVTYSVTNQSGTFTWSVPTNMTIQSGQGTNVINVLVSNLFVSGTISVNLNNGCGGSISSTKTLSTTQSTISSSPISGVRSVCSIIGTNTSTNFSVTPISGVNYNWSVPVNSTIVSGQGTNSIWVTFQNGFTGGDIQLVITGSCGNPVTLTKNVTIGLPLVTINGSSCVDNGYTNTYSVSTTGALSFTWSVPNNAQIVSGQGTNSISVFFPNNFESTCINNSCDSIRLTTQFSCGTVKSTRRIGLLTQRPTITGINQACFPDTIMLTASISPRNTSYIWSNPNGTSFIGSTTGNVVYAKTSSSFFGGTFSVMGVNTCGSSPMGYFGVNKVCDVRMVGLDDNENRNLDFIVYPNPGKGIMEFRVFRGESDIYFVEVKNSLGQVVYSGYNKSEDQINLINLNTGIYFIMVRDNKNNTLIKELFIIE